MQLTKQCSKQIKTIERAIDSIKDIYPEANICLGGSTAYNMALGISPVVSGDVDIFLDVRCARYMFKHILERIIFKGEKLHWISKENPDKPGDRDNYKMPNIHKRITAKVGGLTYDFILMRDASPEELLKIQASTLSQVVYYKSHIGRPELSCRQSTEFYFGADSKTITGNINRAACTPSHLNKIKKFCKKNGWELILKNQLPKW